MGQRCLLWNDTSRVMISQSNVRYTFLIREFKKYLHRSLVVLFAFCFTSLETTSHAYRRLFIRCTITARFTLLSLLAINNPTAVCWSLKKYSKPFGYLRQTQYAWIHDLYVLKRDRRCPTAIYVRSTLIKSECQNDWANGSTTYRARIWPRVYWVKYSLDSWTTVSSSRVELWKPKVIRVARTWLRIRSMAK